MNRPTVLHIIYCMVSAQQANLSECEGQKTAISASFSAQVYLTYMGLRCNAYLSYGCAITILYIIYIL